MAEIKYLGMEAAERLASHIQHDGRIYVEAEDTENYGEFDTSDGQVLTSVAEAAESIYAGAKPWEIVLLPGTHSVENRLLLECTYGEAITLRGLGPEYRENTVLKFEAEDGYDFAANGLGGFLELHAAKGYTGFCVKDITIFSEAYIETGLLVTIYCGIENGCGATCIVDNVEFQVMEFVQSNAIVYYIDGGYFENGTNITAVNMLEVKNCIFNQPAVENNLIYVNGNGSENYFCGRFYGNVAFEEMSFSYDVQDVGNVYLITEYGNVAAGSDSNSNSSDSFTEITTAEINEMWG